MKRHAYLIMAHNEFKMLIKLLEELDDPRNDIYLHIDKKAGRVDLRRLKDAVHKSHLYMISRSDIYWGTISVVKCELRLLEAAVKGDYHYYHLLSGQDFPLKSQDYIHQYLDNKNDEYITCHRDGEPGYDFKYKIQFYYPLLRFVGKGDFTGNSINAKFGRKLAYLQLRLTELQNSHKVDRTRKYRDDFFYKGDQWFSITHDFATYVLNFKKQIMRMYFITDCPDEIFLSTLAMNSPYKERIMNKSLRKIDWERGQPYEFELSDLEELKESQDLFVRKVSYNRNSDLVEALIRYIHKEQ